MPRNEDLAPHAITLPSKAISGTGTSVTAVGPCLITGVFWMGSVLGDNLQVADSIGKVAVNITIRSFNTVYVPFKHPISMRSLIASCTGTGPFLWTIFYAEGV